MEKYAGSGVTLHPQSSSNKENRRTEGLNRYLQTLQSKQSTATGRTVSLVRKVGCPFCWWVKRGLDRNIIIFINNYYLSMLFSTEFAMSLSFAVFFFITKLKM